MAVNYEIKESGGSNQITVDPDNLLRDPERSAFTHRLLDGDRSESLRALHYLLSCGWDYVGETQYEALRALFYKNLLLFFDDGDVPQLVETKLIYETASYDYIGITNPSGTHKAYTDSSASLPSAEGDFETTEFSTANYQAVDGDDSNYVETTNPTADFYLYHKFLIESGIEQGDVQRIRVKIGVLSDDGAPANKDGVVLYGWNQTNWQELDRITSSAKTYLQYNTADSTLAQNLVDASDDYIRLLIRSRATRNGTDSLSLRTYYVEVEVNEGLSMIVSLSHIPTLSSGDVVSVKNLTDATTLVLTTDYTISGRDVTIIGEDAGDNIEITYDRMFEIRIKELYEEWLAGDPGSSRNRKLEMQLQTLSQGVKGS